MALKLKISILMIIYICSIMGVEHFTKQSTRTELSRYSQILSIHIWNYDLENAKKLVELIQTSGKFDDIIIRDEKGNILIQLPPAHEHYFNSVFNHIIVRHTPFLVPIQNDDKTLGEITIHWNNKNNFIHLFLTVLLILIIITLKTQEKIRQSQKSYNEIFELTVDSIMILDTNSLHIVNSNISTTKMFGYSKDELNKLTPLDISSGDSPYSINEIKQHAVIVHKNGFHDFEWKCKKKDGTIFWAQMTLKLVRIIGVERIITVARDINHRKEIEREKDLLQEKLLQKSREAGMSEVAIQILHNIGNSLNSVNISYRLAYDKLKKLQIDKIQMLIPLMEEGIKNKDTFMSSTGKAQKIPSFLKAMYLQLLSDKEDMLQEMKRSFDGLEHITMIVSTQQDFIKTKQIIQEISLQDSIETAIKINDGAIKKYKAQVAVNCNHQSKISTDKNKLTQIIVNLLSNATYAVKDNDENNKMISIDTIEDEPNIIKVNITDNGVGIPKENIIKIFNHNFSTKANANGHGLHISSLTAKELGGDLLVSSSGPGQGSSFILHIPIKKARRS